MRIQIPGAVRKRMIDDDRFVGVVKIRQAELDPPKAQKQRYCQDRENNKRVFGERQPFHRE